MHVTMTAGGRILMGSDAPPNHFGIPWIVNTAMEA